MAFIRSDGFDEAIETFRNISDACERLSQEREVDLSDLLCADFMTEHTQFESAKAFFAAGHFDVSSQEAYEAIPDDLLDAHVAATTDYTNWSDLLHDATRAYYIRQLGL